MNPFEAVDQLRKATSMHPERSEGWRALSRALCQINRPEEAVRCLEQAVTLDPRDGRTYVARAECALLAGDLELSRADCQKALELNGEDVDAYLVRGRLALKQGQSEAALADFERAVQLAPERPEAYAWRARACADPSRRRADLVRSVSLTPENRDYRRQLVAELMRGGLAEALRALKKSSVPEPWKTCLVGAAFEADGAAEEAQSIYDGALSRHPEHPELLLRRGASRSAAGRHDMALKDFNRVLEIAPGSWEAHLERGHSWQGLSEIQRADQDYDQAVRLAPAQPEVWLARGCLRLRARQPEAALSDLSEAVRLDPENPRGWHERGRAFEARSEPERALGDFERALQLGPPDGQLLADRARSLASAGQLERSLTEYGLALEALPDDAEVWFGYAEALRRAGRADEARQALARALEISPSLELRLRRMGTEVSSSVLRDASGTGRAALDRALAAAYPGRDPDVHLLGDDDSPIAGLDCVRGWRETGHWHLIAYGLSELDQKRSSDPGRSGVGVELTLRVAGAGRSVPLWALTLLQGLARGLRHLGRAPGVGEILNLNAPLAPGDGTRLEAVVLAPDPMFPKPISTPYGEVRFLQPVGITRAEAELASEWGSEALLAGLRQRNPLLVTDLGRPCSLGDPGFARSVQATAESSGTSLGKLTLALLEWEVDGDEATVTLPVGSVDGLKKALRDRLGQAQELCLSGPGARQTAVLLEMSATRPSQLILRPAEKDMMIKEAEGTLTVELPASMVERLISELRPAAGEYWFAPGLTIRLRLCS